MLPGLIVEELKKFSIHAPREGSGFCHSARATHTERFLSTLPGRGAALIVVLPMVARSGFLSTLPGRGAALQI